MRAHGVLMTIALTVASCGGGNKPVHVELSGKPPEEAGQVAGRFVCTHDAQCGHPSVTCQSAGPAGDAGGPTTMSCVGQITPVPFDGCFEDASSDISELLTCGQLSLDQVDTLEQCFDILANRACVTQAEVDAMARAREAGGESPKEELPTECALLVTPPASCTGGPPTRQ